MDEREPRSLLTGLGGNVDGTILLVARASGESGTAARRLAVDDLFAAAKYLEAMEDRSILAHLPEHSDLLRRLESATAVVSHSGDRAFRNRFVEVDLVAVCGVYAVVSTGTGRKLDDESLVQPFVTRLAQVAAERRPAALFAKRIDRIVRKAWAIAPLMLVLESCGAVIGDSERGFREPSGLDAVMVFFDATVGEAQADRLPTQTRLGMLNRSGERMVDGQVAFHVGRPAPPGFAAVRMLVNGSIGPKVLVLDRPNDLPPSDQVAFGLPEVKAADGRPVDQVANVRWALSKLGRPGMGALEVAQGLATRGYSTDGLRRLNTPSTTFDGNVRPEVIIGGLLNNLDVYRHGHLEFSFGVDEVDDLVIDGLIPDDGPWATPGDFERIERWQAGRARWRARRTVLTLSGLPVTVNGESAVLVTAPRYPHLARGVGYRVCDAGPYPRRVTLAGMPVLDAVELARVVAESVAAAGDTALPLAPISVDPDQATRVASQAVAELSARRDHHRERLADLRRQLTSRDDDGALIIGGALARDLTADYNEIADGVLRTTDEALAAAVAELEAARVANVDQRTDLRVGALLDLVAALRDPTRTQLSPLLRDALSLDIAVDTMVRSGHGGVRCSVAGELRIVDDAYRTVIPVRGSWEQGSARHVEPRVERTIAAMSEGIPFDSVPVPRTEDLRSEIASHLGVRHRELVAVNCTDPRILRIGMAVTYRRDGRTDAEIAAALGESEQLVTRVASVWARPRNHARWRNNGPQTTRVDCYIIATRDDGWIRFGGDHGLTSNQLASGCRGPDWANIRGEGYRLRPCPHCGHRGAARLAIDEPDGAVCLNCRLDSAGIHWPADPYDRYLPRVDAWVSAGLATHVDTPAER